jgi:hypothetical protein
VFRFTKEEIGGDVGECVEKELRGSGERGK